MINDRRYGEFFISQELLTEFPETVRSLWCGCIPVRVEHHYDRNGFSCIAENPSFRPVDPGNLPPHYQINIETVKNEEGEVIGALAEFET